jgi:hypothetical protein
MKNYRVNKNTTTNPNGNNEVHSEDCRFYSQLVSFEHLGLHPNCQSAVTEAKNRGYYKADGCIVCSPACHRG